MRRIGNKTRLFLGPRIIGDFCFLLGIFVYFLRFPGTKNHFKGKQSELTVTPSQHISKGTLGLIIPSLVPDLSVWVPKGAGPGGHFLTGRPRSGHSNGLFQNIQNRLAPQFLSVLSRMMERYWKPNRGSVSSPRVSWAVGQCDQSALTPPVCSDMRLYVAWLITKESSCRDSKCRIAC